MVCAGGDEELLWVWCGCVEAFAKVDGDVEVLIAMDVENRHAELLDFAKGVEGFGEELIDWEGAVNVLGDNGVAHRCETAFDNEAVNFWVLAG